MEKSFQSKCHWQNLWIRFIWWWLIELKKYFIKSLFVKSTYANFCNWKCTWRPLIVQGTGFMSITTCIYNSNHVGLDFPQKIYLMPRTQNLLLWVALQINVSRILFYRTKIWWIDKSDDFLSFRFCVEWFVRS